MSRSKYQNRTSDPAQIIMQWRAEEGLFKTTNLITKESGELPPPISFIVLDELQAVKGWSTKYDCGIYSNMWKGTEPGHFKVKVRNRGGNDFPITGKWHEIKDKVKAAGGRWIKIIYALMHIKENENYKIKIVKIELQGLALANYVESIKNPYTGVIEINNLVKITRLGKNYLIPEFQNKPLENKFKDEIEAIAVEKDKELQIYLNDYFSYFIQDNIIDTMKNTLQKEVEDTVEDTPPKEKVQIFPSKVNKPDDDMEDLLADDPDWDINDPFS